MQSFQLLCCAFFFDQLSLGTTLVATLEILSRASEEMQTAAELPPLGTDRVLYCSMLHVFTSLPPTPSPLHPSTPPTPPLLHLSTPPLLRLSTPPLLHSSTPPLLHSSTLPLLHSSTSPLLHSSTPPPHPLLHSSTLPFYSHSTSTDSFLLLSTRRLQCSGSRATWTCPGTGWLPSSPLLSSPAPPS